MIKYFCISSKPKDAFFHVFRLNKIVLTVLKRQQGREIEKEKEVPGNKDKGNEGE